MFFSAPRRATVTFAVCVVVICLVWLRYSITGPDPNAVVSQLSGKVAYTKDGTMFVRVSSVLQALGINSPPEEHLTASGEPMHNALHKLSQSAMVNLHCLDTNLAAKNLRKSITESGLESFLVASGFLSPTKSGAVGTNAEDSLLPTNESIDIGLQVAATYATLAAEKSGDADARRLGLKGLAWGLNWVGSGGYEKTMDPASQVMPFIEGVGRTLLWIYHSNKDIIRELEGLRKNENKDQIQISVAIARSLKWLESTSSMKGQGGKPEARFGRAAALHTAAHFLHQDNAKHKAILAAHRYARRAIELQGSDGRYCSSDVTQADTDCDFIFNSHTMAVLYAARLLVICQWTELDDVLESSVRFATEKLVSYVDSDVNLSDLSPMTLRHLTEAVLLSSTVAKPTDPKVTAVGQRLSTLLAAEMNK